MFAIYEFADIIWIRLSFDSIWFYMLIYIGIYIVKNVQRVVSIWYWWYYMYVRYEHEHVNFKQVYNIYFRSQVMANKYIQI